MHLGGVDDIRLALVAPMEAEMTNRSGAHAERGQDADHRPYVGTGWPMLARDRRR